MNEFVTVWGVWVPGALQEGLLSRLSQEGYRVRGRGFTVQVALDDTQDIEAVRYRVQSILSDLDSAYRLAETIIETSSVLLPAGA